MKDGLWKNCDKFLSVLQLLSETLWERCISGNSHGTIILLDFPGFSRETGNSLFWSENIAISYKIIFAQNRGLSVGLWTDDVLLCLFQRRTTGKCG